MRCAFSLMWGCLIHESANNGLEIGLVGPIIGTINVGYLHSIQNRFENCRAHGTGHASKGEDIDDSIEAMQAVLKSAADTQTCFSAYVKGKEAVIVKLLFNLSNFVIIMDGQVFLCPAIHLTHSQILVAQLCAVDQPIPKILPKCFEAFFSSPENALS